MLIILDKDGTLTHTVSGHTFSTTPEDQKLYPGVLEKIHELHKLGASFAIASNQGGVAARHKTMIEAIAEMEYCQSLLRNPETDRSYIDHVYFCPDFQGKSCYTHHDDGWIDVKDHIDFRYAASLTGWYRKPSGGMLRLAMRRTELIRAIDGIEFQRSDAIMIGDRPEDKSAAKNTMVKFIEAEAWREGKVSIKRSLQGDVVLV